MKKIYNNKTKQTCVRFDRIPWIVPKTLGQVFSGLMSQKRTFLEDVPCNFWSQTVSIKNRRTTVKHRGSRIIICST